MLLGRSHRRRLTVMCTIAWHALCSSLSFAVPPSTSGPQDAAAHMLPAFFARRFRRHKITSSNARAFSIAYTQSLFSSVFASLGDRYAIEPLSVCLSVCLSVTLVYCQIVGWIKMKLGMQVGLGPGHIVLDGDPGPPPQRGTAPPNFRPIYVVAKWLDGSRCHLVGR